MQYTTRKALWAGVGTLGLATLGACTTAPRDKFHPEAFGSTTTHARNYAAAPVEACEAARRALLSQGFLILLGEAQQVRGRKNFQPAADGHLEIEFHVVCTADGRSGKRSIAFVNALQDRYALKKSNNSASVGVGAIGSLSLPFTSSDDSLVRVASETITAESFYDRFFILVQRYLAQEVEPAGGPVIAPPARAASAP